MLKDIEQAFMGVDEEPDTLNFYSVPSFPHYYSLLLNRRLLPSELCCRVVLLWCSRRTNPAPSARLCQLKPQLFVERQSRIILCINWAFTKASINHHFNKIWARSRAGFFPGVCTNLHRCITSWKVSLVSVCGVGWHDRKCCVVFKRLMRYPHRYRISGELVFVNLLLLLS